MTRKKLLLAATAIALAAVTSGITHAQGMGPGQGYGMGPGMMQGYGPGWGGGPGMMQGWGQGQGYGMGPGMMQGYGPGWGGGPGMMQGWGQGQGYGMGPGMMQGWGPGMMGGTIDRNLSADDVRANLERWLAWRGNPRLKVGEVKEKDADSITADILTKDNSLVERFIVDRHTGLVRRDNS